MFVPLPTANDQLFWVAMERIVMVFPSQDDKRCSIYIEGLEYAMEVLASAEAVIGLLETYGEVDSNV